MPHVTFVPLTGFRLREEELLALGMSLPGLAPRAKAIGQLPALGLLTLAGMLPEDWTCDYLPAERADEELIERIAQQRATLVAISALTASIDEAYQLSDRLRERGMKTVLGGLHVTACPEEAAAHADAVVVGSAEGVWRDVLADAAADNLQPFYRGRGRLERGDWPQPRLDLLGSAPPRFTLQTQRGCPLACDFCAASRLLGPFQEKPLVAIRQELAAIRQLDARPLVELADDNTFAGSRDAAPLLEALRAANVRYFTEADWRIGERPDVFTHLAASGCAQVLIGIESLVFRYPGMGSKLAEMERIMAAVERVQEAGVPVNGCFIVGADGETRQSLDRLVQFILASPLAEVQLTLQTPFPGTALRRRLAGSGRLLADRGWSHYTLFDVTYQPDCLRPEELEIGFREAVAAVFCREATDRRSALRRRILSRRREPQV
jgi:radical SAM superfamily enzyme YgiQ (UPF0313 family)